MKSSTSSVLLNVLIRRSWHPVSYSWFDSVLSAAISEAPPGALRIHMFVTEEADWTANASPDKPLLQSKEDVSESPPNEKVSESYTSKIIWTYGRPELSTFIFERAYEEDTGGSLAVGGEYQVCTLRPGPSRPWEI